MSEYPCPLCGADCDWFGDCPGYGNPVMVCGHGYTARTITGKLVLAQACGNAALWVCTNPDCTWQFRTPNERSDLIDAKRPEWMHNPLSEGDDDR